MTRRCFLLILFISFCVSCSHFKKQGKWGTKAYQNFSWQHVKKSFVNNIKNPHVWAPLGGALIARTSGWDRHIGEYTQERNIFYSNQEEANTYSDTLNIILEIEMWTSALFSNSWEEGRNWGSFAFNKAKGVTAIYLAQDFAHSATKQLKYATDRQRPDRSDRLSFPSGHATNTGTYRMIISRNLESTDIDPEVKKYLNGATGIIAAANVWSRIGGGAHYPSDALAGYAIGSFVSGFIYDTLMNIDNDETFTLTPMKNNGVMTQYTFRFL